MSTAVVVPVHKPTPTAFETIALRQCGKILSGRKIFLVTPEGLDLGAYHQLLPNAGEIRVARHWMESRDAYNRMMVTSTVFDALLRYSHVLVHEPDALVLRDELDYWCLQPFDYIGAPWFEGWGEPAPGAKLMGVGNFGLSLLRLEALREVLTSRKRWYPLVASAKDVIKGLSGSKDRLRRGLQTLGVAGQMRGAWHLYNGPCDVFWCSFVPTYCPSFRIAPATEALRFSWEVWPARCFELCDGRLPFGFHAWARYDLNFLEPRLRESGVDLSELTSA